MRTREGEGGPPPAGERLGQAGGVTRGGSRSEVRGMPREFDDRQMDRDSVIPRPATTHDKQPHRLTGAHGPLGDGPAKKHSVAQSTAPAWSR